MQHAFPKKYFATDGIVPGGFGVTPVYEAFTKEPASLFIIFEREHHVSKKRQPMSRINRAAQFAPFAALTGYDDLVRESARETETQRFLDENIIEELNDKLVFLFHRSDTPEAAFNYFVRDAKKAGGNM